MSNVVVAATAECGLEVDVVLGANVRKTHVVNAGDHVELTVAGGQTLVVRASAEAAPTAEAELPVGADVPAEVSDKTDADGQPNPPAAVDPNATVASEEDKAAILKVDPDAEFPTHAESDALSGIKPSDDEQADLFADNPFETTDEVATKE